MKILNEIYFYNAKALALELKEGSISELRAIKHFIVTLILGGIPFKIPIEIKFSTFSFELYKTIIPLTLFIIAGLISYYGVLLTYQVNSKGDGKDFFLRFAVLSLPIGIQLFVLFLGIGLILFFMAKLLLPILGTAGVFLFKIIVFVGAPAFIIMFFLRMRTYIKISSGVK